MSTNIIKITDDFWNIRGSFKIKGLVDIGTHASLVRLANGKFIFLDSLSMDEKTLNEVRQITNNERLLEAVINLHPFHTVHTLWMHKTFPNAKHYGTKRHLQKFPNLKWQKMKSEDSELHELYSSDLEFSVPRGVDFIPENEKLHFSSILVYHLSSKTIHVDDTIMYLSLPKLLKLFGLSDHIGLHPTLSRVLEERSEAADEFNHWAQELVQSWSGAQNLCSAHKGTLVGEKEKDVSLEKEMSKAIDKVQNILELHKKKYS